VILIHGSKNTADVRHVALDRVGPCESFPPVGFGFAAPYSRGPKKGDVLWHLPSILVRFGDTCLSILDRIGEVPAERENRIHNGMKQLRRGIEGWELSLADVRVSTYREGRDPKLRVMVKDVAGARSPDASHRRVVNSPTQPP
jgi:hypothetical protein